MNYIEIWNRIVEIYDRNISAEESKLQNLWETIFKEWFNYTSLNNEIDTHRSIRLGSYDRVIPDIILRKDNRDICIIELKRAFPLTNNFRNQLFSYLKQLKLNIGILICDKIYLYYYDYSKSDFEQKEFKIDFKKDSAIGEKFVELFNKNNYSLNKVIEFINKNIKINIEYNEIKEKITPEFIVDLISKFLKNNHYNESSINKYIEQIEIIINNKNMNNLNFNPNYKYIDISQKEIFKDKTKSDIVKLGKTDALKLCDSKFMDITNFNSTYACLDYVNGKYRANVDPILLKNDWYLLLDDCYNKNLYVLKILANSLQNNEFAHRRDNGKIILQINQSFIDEHPQSKIRNNLFKYKIETVGY